MKKKNDLFFDDLNIGGTLEALVHSFVNNIPLIIDKPILPFELDPCPLDWNISIFGFQNPELVTKLQLWDRLSFLLSASGYLLFPNNIQSVRTENKRIVLTTTNNSYYSIYYKNVNLFDNIDSNLVYIYDWFAVHSGFDGNGADVLQSGSDFVKQIIFYPSRRSSVRRTSRDLVAVSVLHESLKDNSEFSEGICRLKVLRMIKEAGFVGTRNGYNKYGKPIHSSVKIEHIEREVKQDDSSFESISKLLTQPLDTDSEIWKTTKKLLYHQRTSTSRASFR